MATRPGPLPCGVPRGRRVDTPPDSPYTPANPKPEVRLLPRAQSA